MTKSDSYSRAGVNIDAGQQAVEMMKAAVQATYTPEVLSNMGSFGGLYDISSLKAMNAPVLVASTDGVGTKTRVAAFMNRWDTIGQDLVNHCINDILVQGARPLFFLDYIASSQLEPEQIADVVSGMAQACQTAGCALLGGETAEMPGVYAPGEIDVVGTVVGVVDRSTLLDGSRIQHGDVILALPSSGLHTNGYVLARTVLESLDWRVSHPTLNMSPGEAMLAVHRCYLSDIDMLRQANIDIRGLAHITGGGVIDNLPRILPEGLGANIVWGQWPVPSIFTLIQQLGDVDALEMFRVFNMGLGMLVVLPVNQVESAQAALPGECYIVGEVVIDHMGITIEGLTD
jgi:phosphoribosylformylglycinamidine cyclo-ligase